jgi:hypothetical protein
VAALTAVVASGLVASAGPVAARPTDGGASTMSTSCPAGTTYTDAGYDTWE